jgi:hypothetical protein
MLFQESSRAPAEAPSRAAALVEIRVLSWNLFRFSYTDGKEEHVMRVHLLASELAASQPSVSVLFIQEVQTGPGGKRAVRELTNALNAALAEASRPGRPSCHYECVVSDPAGDNEAYGVLWDTACALGAEPPKLVLWESAHTTDPPFGIAAAEDLRAVRLCVAQSVSTASGFRRSPLFACFPALRRLLFCSVHLVSGKQGTALVRAEALMLQRALGSDAKIWDGPLVLLGDFNEDDADMRQWVAPGEPDDTAYAEGYSPEVRSARGSFFRGLMRCLDEGWATNLYPLREDARHNDDIWVSTRGIDVNAARLTACAGTIDTVCKVLRHEGKQLLKARGINRGLTAERAKRLYSDHVPVAVTLALMPPSPAAMSAPIGPLAASAPTGSTAAVVRPRPEQASAAPGPIARNEAAAAGSPPAAAESLAGNDQPAAAEPLAEKEKQQRSAGAAPAPPGAKPSVSISRPVGRPPKGKIYDHLRGEWIAPESLSDETLEELLQAQRAPVRRPRPRGRAPGGKMWDYDKGEWVDIQDCTAECSR